MLLHNLRYALRGLRRNPGFTAAAVLTLALGIGANTAIFSVLNAVLLRPLPFHDPAKLVFGWGRVAGAESAGLGPPPFRDYREQNRTLERLAAMEIFTLNHTLSGEGQPVQVKQGSVSANFFATLGLTPDAGRDFVSEDEQTGQAQVVILTRSFWQSHYGGSHAVIGKKLVLDGQALTIAGVMPDVPLLMNVQMFSPMAMLGPRYNIRSSHFLRVIGRIKPDATFAQAQADLDAIAARLAALHPDSEKGWSVRLQPLDEMLVGPVKDALWILLCAVGLVLLIACANVANLLLVRATGRSKEVAIRAAVGASRGRLIRQFLTESLVLSMIGGGVAVSLASWAVAALRRFGPADLPRLNEIAVDGTVLAFAVAVSLLTGLIFGLAPALRATRDQVQATLKGSSQRSGGLLIAAELALSLVLLIGAGLSLKSFWKLIHVDPGFRTDHVVTASVNPRRNRAAAMDQFSQRIAALPDVASIGAISELPMGGVENDDLFRIEGKAYPAAAGPRSRDFSVFHSIQGDYFQTMGTPLRAGRLFTPADDSTGQPVVIINERLAQTDFPGQNPIGRRLIFDRANGPLTREIVGVVGSEHFYSLAAPPGPEMYVPYAQEAFASTMNLVARTRGDAPQIGTELRTAITSVDPSQPPPTIRTLNTIVSATAAQPRFYGALLGLFAAVAALLAAVGLYGVIAYAVGRRAREIGIRMALGATSGDVVRLLAGEGARPVLLGLAAGLAGAFFAARLLASRLFQVTPHDAQVFALVPVLLACVAAAACLAPLRRAMRVDPAASLRQE